MSANISAATLGPAMSSVVPTTNPSGGIARFLKDNLWVPIVGGCVLALAIVGIIICIYRCRRRARFDYTAIKDDVDLPLKLDIDRRKLKDEERDTALLNCSFYLRSTGRYSMLDHLQEMGSRLEKHWFLIKDRGSNGDKLLTMIKKSSSMRVPFNKATKKSISELFILFQHPFIFPVEDIDFVYEQGLIMVLHQYNSKGSLKDLIYNSHCCEGWHGKYCFRGKALAPPQVQIFGRQILEGLLFLEDKGISPMGHLHSGNIIVQDYTCRVAGYENVVFGLSSKVEPLLKRKLKGNKDAIDTLSFGHLLFEMAAGYELDTAAPEPKHLVNISHQPTVEILYFIFENSSGHYPSIKQLSQHDYFKHIVLRELQTYNSMPIHLTTGAKGLLKTLNKNKPKSGKHKMSPDDDKLVEMNTRHTPQAPVGIKEEKKKKGGGKTGKKNKKASIDIPVANLTEASNVADPSAEVKVDIPDSNPGRNALLDDIRKGTAKLKSVNNANPLV